MAFKAENSPRAAEPGDLELARACASGDLGARRRLVHALHPHLLRFFGNKVPRSHVEDLVNDTFVRLFERCLAGYDGRGRLRSFVLGVAYRRMLEHYRDAARVDARLPSHVDLSDRRPSPSRMVAQRQRRQLLCEALRRLPPDLQALLEFHYWNGLTTGEIAQIVGRPLGTVRSQIARARELLEGHLRAVQFDATEWVETSASSSNR